jgi:hypothetical protein
VRTVPLLLLEPLPDAPDARLLPCLPLTLLWRAAAPTDPTPEHEDTLALRAAMLLLLLLFMLPAASAPAGAAGADGMREAPAEEQVREGEALQGDVDEGAEGMPDAAWPKLVWAESTRGGVVVAVLLLLDLLKPVDEKTAARAACIRLG